MTNSGDAAEQIVRMSLEDTEIALKLTGSAAKNLAAALYAVLKNRDKTKIKGRQRLTAMLKSGKELKVFTIRESHLKQFSHEAKRYGVVYCALRGKEPSADGLVDVMVRAEDASKINRIVERFKLSTVDTASIKHEIEKTKAEKESAPPPPEQTMSEDDKLLDEMLSTPAKKEENAAPNPFATGTDKSPLSEPTSKKPDRAAEGTSNALERKPSVREELREIRQERQQKAAPSRSKPIQHTPPKGKKKKSKAR